MGKGVGFYLILNEIRAYRVGDLTFGLIKSPPNHFPDTRDRRGFDHLTLPNSGAFEFLVGQSPTLPHPLPQGGWWGVQLIGILVYG